MDIIQQNLFIFMELDRLPSRPAFSLPAGVSVKWYEPGDQHQWLAIHRAAEIHAKVTADVHSREFGTDTALLAQRQCFLVDSAGLLTATASAWFDENFHGRPYGRVHWVAVVPQCQGQGLSKPLMSIVLQRMLELGHERAYLRTSTARLPAINLYAQFGFVPSVRRAEDAEIWKTVNPHLREPFQM